MKLTNKQKIDQAREVLRGLSKIANIPLNKFGGLDGTAFNKLAGVKKAIRELKNYEISKRWLLQNGFRVAGMLLKF